MLIHSLESFVSFCMSVKKFQKFGFLMLLLSACVTDSGPPPPLSTTKTEDFEHVVRPENLGEAGALAIVVLGAQNYPLIFTLNDIPLATHYQGYIWQPIMPGMHKFHARQASFDFPTMQIPVSKGEITYLVIDNSWFGDTPYKIGTRQDFAKDLNERPTKPVFVQPANPVQAFLPPHLKTLLDTCGPQSIETSCKRALEEIPEILISSNQRAQIAALIKTNNETKSAATTTMPANSSRPVKSWDVAPTVLRDQLMVKIAERFNTGRPADTLVYFQKLNDLPVPIDKNTNFYWARALMAHGDRRGAYSKLSQFIKNIDPSSNYYQPTLRLLTQFKG